MAEQLAEPSKECAPTAFETVYNLRKRKTSSSKHSTTAASGVSSSKKNNTCFKNAQFPESSLLI
jgi:hypothetical protein